MIEKVTNYVFAVALLGLSVWGVFFRISEDNSFATNREIAIMALISAVIGVLLVLVNVLRELDKINE